MLALLPIWIYFARVDGTNDRDETADYSRQKIPQGIDNLMLFSKLVFH